MRTIDDLLNRLRAEFVAMPGVRLTSEQVQRRCAIEGAMCQLLLDSLVDAKFLRVKRGGTYAQLNGGPLAALVPGGRVGKGQAHKRSTVDDKVKISPGKHL